MIFAGIGMLICAALLSAYYYREDQRAAENSERLLQELRAQVETEVVEENIQERPTPDFFYREEDTKDADEDAVDTETVDRLSHTDAGVWTSCTDGWLGGSRHGWIRHDECCFRRCHLGRR